MCNNYVIIIMYVNCENCKKMNESWLEFDAVEGIALAIRIVGGRQLATSVSKDRFSRLIRRRDIFRVRKFYVFFLRNFLTQHLWASRSNDNFNLVSTCKIHW